MSLRRYLFSWGASAHLVLAEDAKDACVIFEKAYSRYGFHDYQLSAVADDACVTCYGAPYLTGSRCVHCKGTGKAPEPEKTPL